MGTRLLHHRGRSRPLAALLAVAVLAAPLLAACSGGPTPAPRSSTPSSSTPGPTASVSPTMSASPSASATSSGPAMPRPPAVPAGLVALWPFTTAAQVRTWQTAFRSGGQQAWHLDLDRTALRFARDRLGYREIDRVVTRSVSATDARVGVGWQGENGRDHSVGVMHLVRFGDAPDAPWVVVGSDDAFLTLTTPRYGATVTSPLAVGGRITGVDESLHVTVLGPTSSVPLDEVTGLPGGGENTPWTTVLRFSAPPGSVLTIAVSTGGHLKAVERFAITAVRAA